MEVKMPAKGSDRVGLPASYAARRTRLLAKRKLEEARLAQARDEIRRIDRELAALDRERMQPMASGGKRGADSAARAARQFASTATR
jgi:hypothetical protein